MLLSLIFAMAMASASDLPELSEAELKHYFMVCDRNASEGLLDDADAATCSVIYEMLKDRCFGGDSKALLEWWREEKNARSPRTTIRGN